ncbi:hypothetical protein OG563_37850 [Nocardia vinacea]|uniref:MYND-type domain-containing protein n=1 Tax=Nocardia vinacea TaxID=96468 RepID=A0ABZ1YNN6_9NOCA|nr:hypothetical protein [Nocardia vinacea]
MADKVADGFLKSDLLKVLDPSSRDPYWVGESEALAYLRLETIEAVAEENSWDTDMVLERINWHVKQIRGSDVRPLLAPYLYGDMPDVGRFCKMCEALLPRRCPDTKGRSRKYCDDACKQRHYRHRKKLEALRTNPEKSIRIHVRAVDLGLNL